MKAESKVNRAWRLSYNVIMGLKMKCDNCKHQKYFYDDNVVNCLKGHWFGFGDPDTDNDQTLWDDCKDFDNKTVQLTASCN